MNRRQRIGLSKNLRSMVLLTIFIIEYSDDLRRLKDKYELEIRDLEMLEKDAQAKYCDSRSKLLEYEEVILTLRNNLKQLEHQLTEEELVSRTGNES